MKKEGTDLEQLEKGLVNAHRWDGMIVDIGDNHKEQKSNSCLFDAD